MAWARIALEGSIDPWQNIVEVAAVWGFGSPNVRADPVAPKNSEGYPYGE